MSSFFQQIRKISDNPSLLKEIAGRLAKVEGDNNVVEASEFKRYLRLNVDRIIYTMSHSAILQDASSTLGNPQLPYEPDGINLSTWLKFIQNTTVKETALGTEGWRDSSGFNNHGFVVSGNPQRASGLVSGLPSLFFNGFDDRIEVTNSDSNNFITPTPDTVGFTVSILIKPIALGTAGGVQRRIANKTNTFTTDATGQQIALEGWSLILGSDGTITFSVKEATQTSSHTFTRIITDLTQWYLVVCTFQMSNHIVKVYVNNVLSGDPASTAAFGLSGVSRNIMLGGRTDLGVGVSSYQGYIADFRYWQNKILTAAMINNLFNNKYTISSISTNVAMAGVSSLNGGTTGSGGGITPSPTPTPSTGPGFTTTGFTSTGFHTT